MSYPKEVDGMTVGSAADELLYRLSTEFPKDIEMIESYCATDDGGVTTARVAFAGRVFRVRIEPCQQGLGGAS